MQNGQKRWLTPQAIYEEYHISKSTQAKLRMERKIPYSKIGGRFIRYDRLEIDKWLENHKVVGIK